MLKKAGINCRNEYIYIKDGLTGAVSMSGLPNSKDNAMIDLSKIYLYRMTHIDNVPHILLNGITHKANPNFTPIGDSSLIENRSIFVLNNDKNLGDCIPFYFYVRMPMLYVIQKSYNGVKKVSPDKIVYCASSVAKIDNAKLDFVFTDGHAISALSNQYTKADIGQLDKLLDMRAIKAKYWNDENDLDLKRRKQAEFLVLGNIPFSAILGFVTYSEEAKDKLVEMGILPNQVKVRPGAYF